MMPFLDRPLANGPPRLPRLALAFLLRATAAAFDALMAIALGDKRVLTQRYGGLTSCNLRAMHYIGCISR